MGWTGTPMWRNPKGKERVRLAIEQEVDAERVIDSALVGNTVYLAMTRGNDVFGAVITTSFCHHEFITKAMSEDMLPYCYDCPKRLLDKLTPTDDPESLKWRKECLERHEAKRKERAEKREAERAWANRFKGA